MLAPAAPTSYAPPKAPLQSVITATLTTPGDAPSADVARKVVPSASAASGSTSFHTRTVRRLIVLPSLSSCPPLKSDVSSPHMSVVSDLLSLRLRPRGARGDGGLPGPATAPHSTPDAIPDPHEPVRRRDHDREEREPDHGVEAAADDPQPSLRDAVRHLVRDPDVGERAEPGALDARQ